MKPNLQLRVQHSGWNQAAPYYDILWEEQLSSSQDVIRVIAALQKGEKVLDIACGSGLVSFPAALEVGQSGSVTATDLSEVMLEIARDLAAEKKVRNISFQQMDAKKLSFPDYYFDVVLCSLGLMYMAEPIEAIKEMYRVLKQGGRCIVLVWGAREHCGWAEIFPVVEKRVSSDVCPLFFQQGTKHTLLYEFDQAGFSDTEENRFTQFLHYDNEDDACDAMFIGGPVALAWKQFGKKSRKSARKEYLESLKTYKNGEGYDVPAEFVVVKGKKD